jgi:single-stranded-DNA-specific exonuclease
MGDIDPLVKEILLKRGVKKPGDIEAFLNPSYDKHLHDPFLLKDMDKAVKRIKQAIDKRQKIVIYGDYDIDGLSATSLLLDVFGAAGVEVSAHIPDRFEEGYGIITESLKKLKAEGAQLVISVDCGSTSLEPLAWAVQNNLDVIVTDHHETKASLPEAVAIINPKQPGDKYPFKDLAGTGVAFKLVQALQQKLDILADGQEKWLLDLVALGTVCDVVELVDENRVLVRYGLEVYKKSRRAGLVALAEVAGIELDDVSSESLGFYIGPRLNAVGRLAHAQKALDLMTTKNRQLAKSLARELDQLNRRRQAEQKKILTAAQKQLVNFKSDNVLVLADKDWSHGIIGIVAAKLLEAQHKPALILQEMGKTSKGSARSFGDFNIVEALAHCHDLLIIYGGHHYAAGCTLKTKDIPKLRQKLNQYYEKLKLKNQTEYLAVAPDAAVEGLGSLGWDGFANLQQLAPYGRGNTAPCLAVEGLEVVDLRKVGADGSHLRLFLKDSQGKGLAAIGFRLADKHPELAIGQTINACFELQANRFNGKSSLQLRLISISQ